MQTVMMRWHMAGDQVASVKSVDFSKGELGWCAVMAYGIRTRYSSMEIV